MPHNSGSPDRFVHDDNGGSGGGGNVTIVGIHPDVNPLPVDDAAGNVHLATILAALLAGIGVTQLTSPWVVSGTVAVTGTQTDALTDTELRASPVPVSGVVTANVSATTATLANGTQTAVSSIAVSVLAANANRKSAIIQNVGSNNIRVGVAGVTATTGVQVIPGGKVTLGMPYIHTGAVFAIRESTDSTVLAQEVA